MADDERDAEVGNWLEVEPLDDVTRRRLVSTAMRETGETTATAQSTVRPPSRTWRWIAAAAAVVVVAIGTLAVVTANGGNNEQQQATGTSLSPQALKVTHDVGDFGDLDDPANLARLRTALDAPATGASPGPQAAADSSTSERSSQQLGTAGDGGAPPSLCGAVVPEGGTIVAQGTGTIDGRRATVVLIETADGTRSTDAVLEDPCELRHLADLSR
jgi:hypothetical protein